MTYWLTPKQTNKTKPKQKAELKGENQYNTSKVNAKLTEVYRTEGKPLTSQVW